MPYRDSRTRPSAPQNLDVHVFRWRFGTWGARVSGGGFCSVPFRHYQKPEDAAREEVLWFLGALEERRAPDKS